MKTDSQLQMDVIAELKWEPSLNAALIGVEVREGIVTLSGHVDRFGDKWNAEQAAQRVAGVAGLAVELEVRLTGANQRSDSDIAHAAANVIGWTAYLPKDAVKVMVEKGWITLSGSVDWEYQRAAALEVVRGLAGVLGVNQRLTVKPHVSRDSVKAEIEAVLARHANEDAHHITVAVDGGDITLSGTVRNWSDRETAKRSAWGTPGVHHVIDKMTFAY